MELFLLRHAKSDHDPSKWQTDSERPLSKKGISRQNHCSIGMSKLDITLEKAWISPYRRTRQTFQIVQSVMNLTCDVEFKHELIVLENPKKILELLINENESNPEISLLLVGHNPHLSDLIFILCNEDIDLKTSELVWINFSNENDSKLVKYYTREDLMRLS